MTIYILIAIYFYINGLLVSDTYDRYEKQIPKLLKILALSLLGVPIIVIILIWNILFKEFLWYTVVGKINDYTLIVSIFKFYILRGGRNISVYRLTEIENIIIRQYSDMNIVSRKIAYWLLDKIKKSNT